MGATGDRLSGLEALDHAEIATGERGGYCQVGIGIGSSHPVLDAACSRRVRVPMRGFIDSQNVSVTAAILLERATRARPGDLSEAERQRLYARGLYFSVQKADSVLTLAADA